jgi:hypothetical protein
LTLRRKSLSRGTVGKHLAVFLLLAALVVPLASGCGGELSEDAEIEEGGGEGGDGGKVAKVGDTVTLEGTSYKVTKAQKKKQVGDNEFNRVVADGMFVIVHLTLTNRKDEPATIVEDAVRIVGGNGKEYTTDTDAFAVYKNQLSLLQEIQPDLSKKVVAVYDIPPKAVKGAKLEVKDLFSDSTGQIALGLR